MNHPRIIASGAAAPPWHLEQDGMRDSLCEIMFGPQWSERSDAADSIDLIHRLFGSAGVSYRQFAVDPMEFYSRPRTIEDRMVAYEQHAYPLARSALETTLEGTNHGGAKAITDLIVVSCTGYRAPGLDILLARDLEMRTTVRRVVIGHMGCYGALVGLRDSLAAVRARQDATVALVCVELCSLHYSHNIEPGMLTSMALFGDAAACVVLSSAPNASGPELVDAYCVSDFTAIEQMSWKITDAGFVMGLSQRVPVTLGGPSVRRWSNCLRLMGCSWSTSITGWSTPADPSILQAIQKKLGLCDEKMALSWEVLNENGNCSSTTVLLMLDRLLKSGRAQPGEWGVMMAFGPGLTLETCLLRF